MTEDRKSQYIVQIGNESQMWDADKLTKNSERLASSHPEAQVYQLDDYDLSETPSPDYSYIVNIGGETQQWDAAKLDKNKDKLFAKYPDAKVQKVSAWKNPYLKSESQVAKENLDAFREENGAFLDGFEARDTAERKMATANAMKGIPVPGEGGISGEERGRYLELSKQEEDLKKAYYNSLDVVYARLQRGESISTMQSDVEKALSNLESNNPEAFLEMRQASVRRSNPRTALMSSKPLSIDAQEIQADYSNYKAAQSLLDDAIKINNAPSRYDSSNGFVNFIKGMGNTFSDVDFWSAGLTEIAENMKLRGVLSTVQQKLGNLNDLSEEAVDAILTDSEKKVLAAFVINTDAQYDRAEDLSRALQAGQSAAESLGFMAEFILTGGISAGARAGVKAGAKKVLGDYLGKLAGKVSKTAVGKYGRRLAGDAIEAAARTLVMPSTYRNMSQQAIQIKEDPETGERKLASISESVARGFADSFIEALAEGGRVGAIGDFFGDALGSIKSAKNFIDKVKKSDIAQLFKTISNSEALSILRAGGWHGIGEEYLEEWYGAALRTITNLEPEALKDFASVDNQLITLTSFLPMTLIGGTISTGQVVHSRKDLEKKAAILKSAMIERGYSEDQANLLVDNLRTAPMRNISDTFTPMVNKIAQQENGNAPELMKAVANFAMASARMQSYGIAYEEQEAMQREILRRDMYEQIGRFWQEDAEGKRSVELSTMEDGTPVYILQREPQEVSIDGEITPVGPEAMAVDMQGNVRFINTIGESETMSLDDYLNVRLIERRGAEEESRVAQEIEQRINDIKSQIVLNQTVLNMGTQENPIEGLVVGMTANGVMVQTQEGATPLTWDEVGNKLSLPNTVMTDAQIEEAEVANLDAQQAAREAMLDEQFDDPAAEEAEIAEGEEAEAAAEEATYNYPRKADGSVDGNALWNENVREWIKWNNQRIAEKYGVGDNGADSINYLQNQIASLEKSAKQIANNKNKETDLDKRMQFEDNEIAVNKRLAELRDILAEVTVGTAEEVVAETVAEETSGAGPAEVSEPTESEEDTDRLTSEVASLMDGTLTDSEIDDYINNNIKKAQKELTTHNKKTPKIGTDKQQYLEEKKKHQAKVEQIQSEIDFWNEVKSTLETIRGAYTPTQGEIVNKDYDLTPLTPAELVADFFGSISSDAPKIRKDSFLRHTGYSESDAKALGFFLRKNSGITMEEMAERIESYDQEQGYNILDHSDPMAGMNALLEAFSEIKSHWEMFSMIKNNRRAQAESEAKAAYDAMLYEIEQAEHMTIDEFETYKEVIARDIVNGALTDAQINELNSIFAEDYYAYENNEINSGRKGTNVEPDVTRRDNGIREDRNPLLQGEQLDNSGDGRRPEERSSENSRSGNQQDGNAPSGVGADSSEGRTAEEVNGYGEGAEIVEPDNDGERKADSAGVAGDSAAEVSRAGNRSDIRVFEEGLESSRSSHSDASERDRREAESQRLINIAKANGLYVPIEETANLGVKVQKRTGESVVYINEEEGKVYKVKDPYAKSAMKAGVEPEDAIFEFLIHNILFPETAYTFVGITEQFGEVRIILSQDYVSAYERPTQQQIADALAERGLQPETRYSFANDLVSITDVEGDNVILGEDGTLYFIDPIIRFKKPVREILDTLSPEAESVGETEDIGDIPDDIWFSTEQTPASKQPQGESENGFEFNRHGVCTNPQTISVPPVKTGYAIMDEVKLAEFNGKWGSAVDAHTGTGGMGSPLSKERCTFDTREEAIASAYKTLIGFRATRNGDTGLKDLDNLIKHLETEYPFVKDAIAPQVESKYKFEDGVAVNPDILEMPNTPEGDANRIYIAERDGKWGYGFEALMDNGTMSGPTKVQLHHLPYNSREEAIAAALGYFKFYRELKKDSGSSALDAFVKYIQDTYLSDYTPPKKSDSKRKSPSKNQEETAVQGSLFGEEDTTSDAWYVQYETMQQENNLPDALHLADAYSTGDEQYIRATASQMREHMSKMTTAQLQNLIDNFDDFFLPYVESRPEDMKKGMEQAKAFLTDYARGLIDLTNKATSVVTAKTEGEIAAERENKRRQVLRNRATAWQEKLGVKVNIIENVDEVTNPQVAKDINNGEPVQGWFDPITGEVYLYIPNIKNVSVIDKTFLHEFVAHKGLRQLLGEEKYGELCDKVWEAMSDKDKAEYINRLGVNGRTRVAADEYIAELAENIDYNKTLWQEIVDSVKAFLAELGIMKASDVEKLNDFLSDLLVESYRNLSRQAEKAKTKAESKPKAEKTEKKTTSSRSTVGTKIEDFGEKIGGARKDAARSKIRDAAKLTRTDLKKLNDPDKILSRKQIIKYLAEGQMTTEDAQTLLAVNMAVRGESYTQKEVALEKYRDLALAWESGKDLTFEITEQDIDVIYETYSQKTKDAIPELRDRIRKSLEMSLMFNFKGYLDTYKELNYPAEYRDLKGTYVRYGQYDSKYWVVSGPNARRGWSHSTMADAIARIKRDFPVIQVAGKASKDENGKETYGHLYVVKGKYHGYQIKSRDIPGDIYMSSKVFPTRKLAEAYIAENAERLMEKERAMAEALMGSDIGMVERQGKDYRNGKDVTPQDFMDTFGFRGVEFGNWVPQTERQMYLNKTYDAIMDFCEVVGISPKAFSLGGRLGLAFGARGKSRALAHYEPMKEVINLTRMKGAGSLAHEWFHALDNYLAKQNSGDTSDMATASRKTVREEVSSAFDAFVRKMNSLAYTKRSYRAGAYWGEVWERAARLFESYIYNELGGRGTVSPLLVREDILFDEQEMAESAGWWPYPSAKENEEMKPFFDALFDAIQEQAQEDGSVVLYRSKPERDENVAGLESLVERTFRTSGAFSFSGKETIESRDDVAFIFKQLEDSAVENAFLVFVKNGVPTIIHVGMGGTSYTMIDNSVVLPAYKDFGADKVYMVHNHPSCALYASRADIEMLGAIQNMLPEVTVEGIIINTVSGNYATFDWLGKTTESAIPEEGETIDLEVLSFDRNVFSPDYKSEIGKRKIQGPEDIASFLSAHRLGEGTKVGALLLNRQNAIYGNIVTNDNEVSMDTADDLATQIAEAANRTGSSSVILFGDFDYSDRAIKRLEKSIKRISGDTVTMLDVVRLEGKHTQSLMEQTLPSRTTLNDGVRYRAISEMDKSYMDAVEAGDMETAQRMVIEAARLAMPNTKVVDKYGNPKIVMHLSSDEFTKFGEGINTNVVHSLGFFTDELEGLKDYHDKFFPEGFPYRCFLNCENPLVIDFKGQPYWSYKDEATGEELTTDLIAARTKREGKHDGLIMLNVGDELAGNIGDDINDFVPFYPSQIKSAEPVTYDDEGNVIPLSERFNPENADIRYRASNENQEIFVSNAARAVEGIKQEKATPEQWLKMIEKAGGLKAGEDKWMGLSDWLKASDKKTLTKQEVLDFINENMIIIEEQHYIEEVPSAEDLWYKYEDSEEGIEAVNYQMELDAEAYAESELAGRDLTDEEWEQERERLIEDYIEDDLFGSNRSAAKDAVRDNWFEEEAPKLAEGAEREINSTRIAYTTDGLDNLHEIALTVPSIEPWNESDDIHFGDAGEGRAVAWIRFGDASKWDTTYQTIEVDEFEKPYKNFRGWDVYVPSNRKGKGDYITSGNIKDGRFACGVYIKDKLVGAYETFEEAKEAMNAYYRDNPEKRGRTRKVLVIDEIQSKRHQEGREKGYKSQIEIGKEAKRIQARLDELHARLLELENDRRENSENELTEIERLNIALYKAQSIAEYDAILEAQENIRTLRENREAEAASLNSERNELKYQLSVQADRDYMALYSAIPDAPFDKNWHELAMKRMLRYAAENGYDVVAWTKGDQQAERYNIGNLVREIISHETESGRIVDIRSKNNEDLRFVVDAEGKIIDSRGPIEANDKMLSDVVGKEVAKDIMEGVGSDITLWDGKQDIPAKKIDGDGLRIGGEGMKGFYDKMLPTFMNKYGKKWGIKVEDMYFPGLEGGLTMHSIPVTEEMKASVMEGQVMYRARRDDESAMEFHQAVVDEHKSRYNDIAEMKVFPINEATAKRFGYTIEKLRKLSGLYVSSEDLIAIFANEDETDSIEIEDTIFHESIHKLVDFFDHLKAVGEWMWSVADKYTLFAGFKKHIEQEYSENEYAEEMMCSMLGGVMPRGLADELLSRMPENIKKNCEQIFNEIGYDRRRERAARVLRYDDESAVVSEVVPEASGANESRRRSEEKKEGSVRYRAEIVPEVQDEMDAIHASSIVMGNFMKAPNGKDTNLTEEQWLMVRTKGFKEWFGDWLNDPANSSKVVDENGEPMVVYHGSESRFNVFDKNKGRANMDIQGMFFSPWEDDARGYGSDVRGFYLNVRKPANESTGYNALKKYQGQNGAGIKARKYLVAQGYDGVNNEDQEFVAFEPNQIKSATDNTGEFSTEDNDIRYRAVPLDATPTDEVVAGGLDITDRQVVELAGNLFDAFPADIRKKITDKMNGNPLNLQSAIFAIPAELAGKESLNDEERAIASIIAREVQSMIDTPMTRDLHLSEALWMLYDRVFPTSSYDLVGAAKKAQIKDNLGFSERKLKEKQDDIRYRAATQAEIDAMERNMTAADLYNRDVTSALMRLRESFQDMNRSVQKMVDAVVKKTGKAVKSFEDIMLALNQLSSKNLADKGNYLRNFLMPMWDAVLAFKEKGKTIDDVIRYVMLKHGLERNDVLAQRDARNYYKEAYDKKVRDIEADKSLSDAEKQDKKDKAKDDFDFHVASIQAGTDAKYRELRERDYGAIMALYSDYVDIPDRMPGETVEQFNQRQRNARRPKYTDLAVAEAEAAREVEAFENANRALCDRLWKRINAATKETLKHQYEHNVISKQTYDHVRGMFEFYIPLRGFKEDTAEDIYSYYGKDISTDFANPLIRTKGRTTLAESPFGWIGSMAESAIQMDNKNDAKMRLYYFAVNRPEQNLLTLQKTWYKKTGEDADGRSIWEASYPNITPDMDHNQTRQEIERHDAEMKALAASGQATQKKSELNLRNSVVNISDKAKPEHAITVLINGEEQVMYVNGNPRAAQAINGMLNIDKGDSSLYRILGQKITRWMSRMNTSYNPAFWISNYERDLLFTIMSINVKEDKAYRDLFWSNYVNPVKVTQLLRKYEKGELDMSNPVEKAYKEFADNGGITGFTVLANNEEYDKLLDKYSRDVERSKFIKGAQYTLGLIQDFGEGAEQASRFAAYMTSRQVGRSIEESIGDAKEVTVNFNRKGSGKAISWEETGNLSYGRYIDSHPNLKWCARVMTMLVSSMAPAGRSVYMFFNASIQGLKAFVSLYKKNPGKAAMWSGAYFGLGFALAALNHMINAIAGGDDDDYLDIPDWERRNNIIIGGNGFYIKWALPQEARPFYAVADIILNKALGRSPDENLVEQVGRALLEVLPVNPLGEGGFAQAVVPSALSPLYEIWQNTDYKGMPLYRESYWSTGEEPKYDKAFSGTGKVFVEISRLLNEASGGDYAEAGAINIHPAAIEHLIEGYGGGTVTFFNQLLKTLTGNYGEGEWMVRNTPFLNRVVTINDERYRNSHTSDVFKHYENLAKDTKRIYKVYKSNDDVDKIDELMDQKRYDIMKIYERYSKKEERYDDLIRDAEDERERRELMAEQDEIRRKMIKEISEL